mmetsp:Transcript_6546/g.9581  ORF Transcript_6546/g.9581 Transcript_6546/m.9581 type:complete len:346 (+) Transcript_6546:962-1999(+)
MEPGRHTSSASAAAEWWDGVKPPPAPPPPPMPPSCIGVTPPCIGVAPPCMGVAPPCRNGVVGAILPLPPLLYCCCRSGLSVEPYLSPTTATRSRRTMTFFNRECSSTDTCVAVASATVPMYPFHCPLLTRTVLPMRPSSRLMPRPPAPPPPPPLKPLPLPLAASMLLRFLAPLSTQLRDRTTNIPACSVLVCEYRNSCARFICLMVAVLPLCGPSATFTLSPTRIWLPCTSSATARRLLLLRFPRSSSGRTSLTMPWLLITVNSSRPTRTITPTSFVDPPPLSTTRSCSSYPASLSCPLAISALSCSCEVRTEISLWVRSVRTTARQSLPPMLSSMATTVPVSLA